MRVARKHHLCEKYIMNSMEVILAAGGTSASEEMLDTVEIFFIVNEVWSTMVQVILFEIFYTNLHELFCQFISRTNWVSSSKFMDNC